MSEIKQGRLIEMPKVYEANIREFIRASEKLRQELARLALKQSRHLLRASELPIAKAAIEENVSAAITKAVGTDGKPMFQNETARKNALTNALRNDTKYSKILVAMRTAKSKAINMEADDAILKATLSTFQSLKDLNMILLTDFYKQIK